MGQVLHGSARTTEAIRRAIQHSEASLRALSKRYGINQKTVAKWKRRTSVADVRTGPKEARSTVLSIEDEAVVVAFRRHTLLPLDDCLYALQATIPHLTRSSLHRCLQRHGISRLPEVDGDKPDRRKFKSYPIGYFHIDIAEVRTEQGKLHLFVAIDRTSKFAFVELHEKATTRVSADFLRRLLEAVPYRVHTVLTDNGIQFTTPGAGGSAVTEIQEALAKGELFGAHAFELACAKAGIDHRTNNGFGGARNFGGNPLGVAAVAPTFTTNRALTGRGPLTFAASGSPTTRARTRAEERAECAIAYPRTSMGGSPTVRVLMR